MTMEQSSTPVLFTPKLEAALTASYAASKLPPAMEYVRLRKLDRWTNSISLINQATRERRVYNAELSDARDCLAHGINDAVERIEHSIRHKVHEHHDPHLAEIVWANVGCLQMNYAAGRVRRLGAAAILPELRQIAPEIDVYIALLEEIVAIWASIGALKPYILKGRKPAENPKVIDLTHTGLCPACFGTFKLTPGGNLVPHGFEISTGNGRYLGFRMGSCEYGVGYLPYEKSSEGTRAYQAHVTTILHNQMESLRAHLAGEVTEVSNKGYERVCALGIPVTTRTYHVGDPKFADFLARDIEKLQWDIQFTEKRLDDLQSKIDCWKVQPLYDELHPTAETHSYSDLGGHEPYGSKEKRT